MNDITKSPQIKSKSNVKNHIALAKTSLTIGSILALLGGWVALAKAEPSIIETPVKAIANQQSAAVQPQSNPRNRPGAPPERSAPASQVLPTRPSVSSSQSNTQAENTQPEYSQPEAARGSVMATPAPQATQAARPTAVAPTATPRAAVAAQPTPQARAQSSQRPAPSTRTRSSR